MTSNNLSPLSVQIYKTVRMCFVMAMLMVLALLALAVGATQGSSKTSKSNQNFSRIISLPERIVGKLLNPDSISLLFNFGKPSRRSGERLPVLSQALPNLRS